MPAETEADAAGQYEAATQRVGSYMQHYELPHGLVARHTQGAEGVMTAEELLGLYRMHDHAAYASEAQQDARLQRLQAQADRDEAASSAAGLGAFATRLRQDMSRIRCSSLSEYFVQLGDVLRRDDRPLVLGLFLTFVGLLSMAMSRHGRG